MSSSPAPQVLFLTGRLAERLVQHVADEYTRATGIPSRVIVLPISVAALMHVDWVLQKLPALWPEQGTAIERVYVPGWCRGELTRLSERFGVPFELGPVDIRDLSSSLGMAARGLPTLNDYDIEILAEINHVPRMSETELLTLAERYRADGADVIDLGMIPGESWAGVGEAVSRLVHEGHRVSIDSFDRDEVETAVGAGAELVLSCQRSNLDWLSALGVEVVAIPEVPHDLEGLSELAEELTSRGTAFRLDPILEPIGIGLAASLARYIEVRRRYPQAPILMGVGNVTELAEADTAGMSLLLAGVCQELRVTSVLTTEVAAWCRNAVREFDLARRIVKVAVEQGLPAKAIDPRLLLLRDRKITPLGQEVIDEWARSLKDPNVRIVVERGEIHLLHRDGYWHGTDAFELFDRFTAATPPLDVSHAFYLGYELSKAVTALTLGKKYVQDTALDWGFLTVPEQSAHERRRREQNG